MLASLKRNLAALIVIGTWCLSVQGFFFTGLTSSRSRDPVYGTYWNASIYPGEECNRVCREGENFICYFEFTLEYYQAMGIACGLCDQGVESDCDHPQCIVGDGWKKGVMSINRRTPGPPIHVCQNDIVIIDVHNKAHGTAAALHWHGVHMVKTPYMDGVPYVTQCPISYSSSFRYQFRATEAGTLFYHSHAGHHKANGQQGALIIREPDRLNPFRNNYHYDLPEHYIFITDWMHVMAEQFYPGLDTAQGIFADSIVINGRGVHTDPKTGNRTRVPPTIYYVEPGKHYRFRLINGINHACSIQMQIEKHDFNVIASDSFYVRHHTFDTLVSNGGERYDFILAANHTGGDFWMRVRGFGTCAARPTESYALIRYRTHEDIESGRSSQIPPFPKFEETYPATKILNHPNATCWSGTGSKCVTELFALEEDTNLHRSEPHHKFFLAFDNYEVSNTEIFNNTDYTHFANLVSKLTAVGAINNISLEFPDYVPLTEPELINEDQFCDINRKPARCRGKRFCHCVHRLKVELNSIVELIIVDETAAINPVNHPFHLHGYRFMVTGMGQHPQRVPMTLRRARQMENRRQLPRHVNPNPPFKDTVSIPSRGYVIIRFRATNPGFWLMHCHYEWHLSIGMGLVLQVGETSQMVSAPINFPKCSSHVPREGVSSRRQARVINPRRNTKQDIVSSITGIIGSSISTILGGSSRN